MCVGGVIVNADYNDYADIRQYLKKLRFPHDKAKSSMSSVVHNAVDYVVTQITNIFI